MTIELPAPVILTRDQEIDLAKRIEAGLFARHLLDLAPCPANVVPLRPRPPRGELEAVAADGDEAWRDFFLANLRLVMFIAMRWSRRYRLDVEDVFQEGCLGLATAIQRWDHARGTKFCTLAWAQVTCWVRRACVERGGACEAPSWWMDTQNDLRRRHGELQGALGRETVTSELATTVGRTSAWVERTLAWEPPRSVSELPDVEAEPEPETDASARMRCSIGLAQMPDLERRVVIGHFGLSGRAYSYESMAASLGYSVRQIKAAEVRGLVRLRGLVTDMAEQELAA